MKKKELWMAQFKKITWQTFEEIIFLLNLFAFSNFEANFLLFATMAVSTSLWLVALSKTFLIKIMMVAELVGFCNFLFLTLYFFFNYFYWSSHITYTHWNYKWTCSYTKYKEVIIPNYLNIAYVDELYLSFII